MNDFFKRKEFACKCGCGFDVVDHELLGILTSVREYYGLPIKITSGCRCESHNRKVGGAKRSQHRHGKAVDFQVQGMSPKIIQKYLCDTLPKDRYGVGLADTFTHLDVREKAARFNY
ncbi:MAG: D-Ala-D-Ala carboxypeptidase family metallohydrolase [Bacteroidales bacterium]